MRKVILFMLFWFQSQFIFGQGAYDRLTSNSKKATEMYIQGDYLYVRHDYTSAITWFEKAIKKDKKFVEAYFRMGSSYYRMFDTLRARLSWENAVAIAEKNSKNAYLHYYLGQLYYDIGAYQEGLDATTAYFAQNPLDRKFSSRVARLKVLNEFAISSIAENLQYNPQPMNGGLNKFPMQYFPALPADMQSIFFTRRTGFDPTDDEDIYISILDEKGEWGNPNSLSDNINSHGNEGTCSISGDGRTLIFTSCLGREGYGSCDLFITYKEGGSWSVPENMGSMINSGAWDSQPSLSADGRTLYFVSDRSGGEGMRDIWRSQKGKNEKWMKAKNLGNTINTPREEVSPFIHLSGERIYFASDGHIGMGGFDIYYSDKASDSWGDPVNMGYPLNTKNDQVSLVITPDGQHGYYSLDINSGGGRYRSLLYKIDIPEKHRVKFKSSYVKGVVYDAKSKRPMAASVELKDLQEERQILKVSSDKINGKYLMVLTEGATYGLFVSSDGYLYKSLTFEFDKNDSGIEIDIYLDPIEKGAVTTLNNVFFDIDSDVLDSRSDAEIAEVAGFLKSNKEVRILIEGHTDDSGSEVYNLDLSNRRAKAVYNRLILLGLPSSRITYQGLGMSRPIVENSTSENKAKNRRIEFTIVD